MGLAAQVAQLQHIAQQSKAALAGKLLEHGQSGFHAVGVGVVAVLDDVHAACVDDLLAHTGLLKIADAPDDLPGVQPQPGGGAVGSQGVGDVVAAHGGDLHEESPLFVVFQHEAHAVGLLLDGQGADIRALVAEAEPDGLDVLRQLRFPQEGVVAVQHEGGTLRQTGADLQLCLADVLLTAQVADVGHTDAGDDAHIRAGALAQALDLPGVAHAHLHHGVLGIPADAEHGAGQTQLIVLVALGLDGIPEALDGGVAHLLGGGLAHAAGHAHHLGVELAAVVRTQHHHGVVAVRAEDGLFRRDALDRVVHHHAEGPFFQRLGREVVAVEPFPRKGHEDAAGAHLAAVGGHEGDFRLPEHHAVRRKAAQQRTCFDTFHKYPIPFFQYCSIVSHARCLRRRHPQVMVTMVPRCTLEPAASLCAWTRPFPSPSTTQFRPAAASICRAKSALLPETSGTSVCLPSYVSVYR